MSEDKIPYNTKALKRGTYVSRAAYAKLQGENKALLKDIYILCHEKYALTPEPVLIMRRWRDKFKQDEHFRAMLKEIALKHARENPDSFSGQILREQEERLKQLQELDNHPQL
jgi:hypothetical protein